MVGKGGGPSYLRICETMVVFCYLPFLEKKRIEDFLTSIASQRHKVQHHHHIKEISHGLELRCKIREVSKRVKCCCGLCKDTLCFYLTPIPQVTFGQNPNTKSGKDRTEISVRI